MRFTRYTRFSLLPVHHMYCRHIFFFAVISTAIEHCTRFLSLFLSLFSLFPIPCLAYFPSSLLSSLASSTSTIRTFFYLHRPLLTFVAVSRYISRLRFTSALKKKKNPQPVSVSPVRDISIRFRSIL